VNTLQKLGLTPIYVRVAANYMAMGVGEYKCAHFGYDRVVVRQDTSWNNYAFDGAPEAYFMTICVDFYSAGQRQKWFEFKTTMVGGGSREGGLQLQKTEEN